MGSARAPWSLTIHWQSGLGRCYEVSYVPAERVAVGSTVRFGCLFSRNLNNHQEFDQVNYDLAKINCTYACPP